MRCDERSAHPMDRFFLGTLHNGRESLSPGSSEAGFCSGCGPRLLLLRFKACSATTPFVLISGTGLMVVAAASAATVPLRRALAADSATLMR